MSIPFIDLKSQYLALKPQIQERIERVLEHGQYIMGPEVSELEGRLAHYTGANHCITVASGTEALLISLMALGIGVGDEVITTPFTFVATAEVIALLGARPIFVDIRPDTCNINPDKIAEAITPRTKAIMPVSLYGQPADMDEINSIAERHGNVPVIEDGAQSFGATYKNRKSCNLSLIGCTSFFPSKPLGCYGDGGAIFTSDDSVAALCREIRVHGQRERYVHERIGVGGRMDTIQCAVVLGKLDRFDWEIQQRVRLGQLYVETIHERCSNKIEFIKVAADRQSVWAQFTVKVENRELIQSRLKEAGIPTAVHYPKPLHLQQPYTQKSRRGLPESERVAARVLSLPMSPDLKDSDLIKIVDELSRAVI
ncbi:DegT/DnrJ/EryC1/StrS family aminotransferase [Sedimenticola sp.]|uniref:DegT/DnrJ/EryC1/StrS family aminotransferase n=1 Tax=Sedimenticola sp. TaxID=1940285 RepID=UPI003D104E06